MGSQVGEGIVSGGRHPHRPRLAHPLGTSPSTIHAQQTGPAGAAPEGDRCFSQ